MYILLTILGEILFITLLILFFYRLKPRFGLAPLYVLLGSFQYFQTILFKSTFITIYGEYNISLSATILFCSGLFSILLIYIKESVQATRNLIMGIVLTNLAFAILTYIIGFEDTLMKDIVYAHGIGPEIFSINLWMFSFGTITLILDAFIIVILYEYFYIKLKLLNLFTRLLITMLIVFNFDAVVFSISSFWNSEKLSTIIISQMMGKSVIAIFFAIFLYIYLRYFDKDKLAADLSALKGNEDIFSILTYKGKYEKLKSEKVIIEENLQSIITAKTIELNKALHRYSIMATVRELRIDKYSTSEQANEFLNKIQQAFEVDACSIHLMQEERLEMFASTGITGSNKDFNLSLTFPYIRQMLVDKKSINIADTRIDPLFNNEAAYQKGHFKYISCAGAPLLLGNKVTGLLKLYSVEAGHKFSEMEMEHLQLVAIQLANSIEASQIYKQNEKHKEVLVKQILARKKAEVSVRESEEKFRTLVEQATDSIFIADENLQFIEVNSMACTMLGFTKEELLQMKMPDLAVHQDYEPPHRFDEIRNGNTVLQERVLRKKDGSPLPVEISAGWMQNKYYLSIVRDITERKKTERQLENERKTLEMIAIGKPINEILNQVVFNNEFIFENAICSIQLISDDGLHLINAAAPGLPNEFNNAVNNLEIGPMQGSCGAAAFSKERVIVSDIANDPRWAKYKDFTLSFNLKACWSSPILDAHNKVLATFAIYYKEIRVPSSDDLILIDRSANKVKIALEKHYNEIQIKESEEKYRSLIERVSDAFVALDKNWVYTYVNKKAAEIFGREPEDLIGKNIWVEFPEGIGQPFNLAYEKAMKEQQKITILDYYPPFDKWFENHIYPSAEGISIYFRDITERIKSEETIRNSEEKYRTLAEAMPDYVMRYDREGRHMYMNKAALEISGKTAEEVFGKTHVEAGYDPEQAAFWEEKINAVFETGESFQQQFEWEGVKGKVFLDWRLTPELDEKGNVLTVLGVSRDITELKMVELKLAENENRLRIILETEPECVKVLNEHGEILDMNRAGLMMIEADDLAMIKGLPVLQIIDQKYREEFLRLTKNVFKGISGRLAFEITGLKGTRRWLETHVVPMKDADGKIISLLGITRDITESKKAEEEIHKLQKDYFSIISSVDGIVWEADAQTFEFSFVSKQAEKILGYSVDDWINSPTFWADHIFEEDRNWVVNYCTQCTKDKKDHEFEYRMLAADGSIVWLRDIVSVQVEKNKPAKLVGIMVDITESKQDEVKMKKYNDQLQELTGHLLSIREEERRRIGREIHDDLGQQLTAIKMDVSWIDKKTPEEAELVKIKLKNIISLLDGSNLSIRRILSELKPSILDEYGLLDALQWQAKQFTENTGIPVVINSAEKSYHLPEAISTCLFRVFQESLTNITRYAEANMVQVFIKQSENILQLRIEDNGIGFEKNLLHNKKTFGIIGMKERVRALNGKLSIDTIAGKGTKITVNIPL